MRHCLLLEEFAGVVARAVVDDRGEGRDIESLPPSLRFGALRSRRGRMSEAGSQVCLADGVLPNFITQDGLSLRVCHVAYYSPLVCYTKFGLNKRCVYHLGETEDVP